MVEAVAVEVVVVASVEVVEAVAAVAALGMTEAPVAAPVAARDLRQRWRRPL